MIGSYDIVLTLTDDETDPGNRRMLSVTASFTVHIIEPGCTNNLIVPADNSLDISVVSGSSTLQNIPLNNISNGSCLFRYDITYIGTLSSEQINDVFNTTITDAVTQPVFT